MHGCTGIAHWLGIEIEERVKIAHELDDRDNKSCKIILCIWQQEVKFYLSKKAKKKKKTTLYKVFSKLKQLEPVKVSEGRVACTNQTVRRSCMHGSVCCVLIICLFQLSVGCLFIV